MRLRNLLSFQAGGGYCPDRSDRVRKRAEFAAGVTLMAGHVVPHFANDMGAEKVTIGVKEFQCMGARPPFDHPHVFLDMGADAQTLCPYCSTLYVYDARLGAEESEPPGCIVSEQHENA
jgi:uncharacterized Zn-finger protein